MTHVADDAMLGKFVRRIKGLIERAMVGSLNLDKIWDIVQGYLDGKLTNIEGVLSGTHEIRSKTLLSIDRTKPFDPIDFITEGWKIEEEDERSLALSEVDLITIQLGAMPVGVETSAKDKTWLEQLNGTGNTCLDAKVFQTIWDNKKLIPEYWKKQTNGQPTYILFVGTLLEYIHGKGRRWSLALYWEGSDWRWTVYLVDRDLDLNHFPAVLVDPSSVQEP